MLYKLNVKNYNGSLTIYSITGQVVMQVENVNGQINIGDLQKGIYIVQTADQATRLVIQ